MQPNRVLLRAIDHLDFDVMLEAKATLNSFDFGQMFFAMLPSSHCAFNAKRVGI